MTYAPADGNWHGVILRLYVQAQLLQSLHNLYPRVETLHSLQWIPVRTTQVIRNEAHTWK